MSEDKLAKGYLQWRCRRGTKELDVVLTQFLDINYTLLSESEISDFNRLLDQQDTILWYWIIGKEQPDSKKLQSIIQKINAHH